MSEFHRRRSLGGIALGLAIASILTIPVIFIVVIVGDLLWTPPRVPVWFLFVLDVIVMALPALALAAIITGHTSRRRNRSDRNARPALFIGYGMLGLTVLFGILGVLTFVAIR